MAMGFTYQEVMRMPLDLFYLHAEGSKRFIGHRRKQSYVDLVAAISGALTKGAAKKYLNELDE